MCSNVFNKHHSKICTKIPIPIFHISSPFLPSPLCNLPFLKKSFINIKKFIKKFGSSKNFS